MPPSMANIQGLLRNWVSNGLFYGIKEAAQSIPITVRRRNTAAEVFAGATLVAAMPGFAFRLIDYMMIAIGGTVATVTDVRVLGTRSGSSVALGIAAAAGLVQDRVLRLGQPWATAGTAAIIALAAGAAHTVLDVNTAITIGSTGGGSLTGATSIDTILTYTCERV